MRKVRLKNNRERERVRVSETKLRRRDGKLKLEGEGKLGKGEREGHERVEGYCRGRMAFSHGFFRKDGKCIPFLNITLSATQNYH